MVFLKKVKYEQKQNKPRKNKFSDINNRDPIDHDRIYHHGNW